MMSLTKDEIKQIAHLARLSIKPEETEDLQRDLSHVLDWVTQMNQVDTSGVEPMASPLSMLQRLREDEVTEKNQRAQYQQIAPQVEKGLYLVPKVID